MVTNPFGTGFNNSRIFESSSVLVIIEEREKEREEKTEKERRRERGKEEEIGGEMKNRAENIWIIYYRLSEKLIFRVTQI